MSASSRYSSRRFQYGPGHIFQGESAYLQHGPRCVLCYPLTEPIPSYSSRGGRQGS
jgi:hypothetical protein